MAQSTPLDYQIRLEFFFAYERDILIRRAYGADELSPWDRPARETLDHAALELVAFLLSGYDVAAEEWAVGVQSQEVQVALSHPEIRRPYWSVRLGTGKPGPDLDGLLYSTGTPFERVDEAHVCCVQLVSPAFKDTDGQWTDFATSTQRILNRLQKPGVLHPSHSAGQPRIDHLAWANKTCSLTVTVRAVDDTAHISWPALQNLYAAWGSCADKIERLQNPQHSTPKKSAFRKLVPTDEQSTARCLEQWYSLPNLRLYMNLESLIAAQAEITRVPIMTDRTGELCTGVRFEEHRGTLDVPQIQFWTRLTYRAVVSCQAMAAGGRRFGVSKSAAFMQFSDDLIRDQWVRDFCFDMLKAA
ncbi:MAG: hypothetical protein LQ338_006606 [Usnochroma carphineum]|nr:MAG: hypothetical protein LQ338_006606 [Usnochroma carphineum]